MYKLSLQTLKSLVTFLFIILLSINFVYTSFNAPTVHNINSDEPNGLSSINTSLCENVSAASNGNRIPVVADEIGSRISTIVRTITCPHDSISKIDNVHASTRDVTKDATQKYLKEHETIHSLNSENISSKTCKLIQVILVSKNISQKSSITGAFDSLKSTMEKESTRNNRTTIFILASKCTKFQNTFVTLTCVDNNTKAKLVRYEDEKCTKPVAEFTYDDSRWYNNRLKIKILASYPPDGQKKEFSIAKSIVQKIEGEETLNDNQEGLHILYKDVNSFETSIENAVGNAIEDERKMRDMEIISESPTLNNPLSISDSQSQVEEMRGINLQSNKIIGDMVVLQQFSSSDCIDNSMNTFYILSMNSCTFLHGKFIKVVENRIPSKLKDALGSNLYYQFLIYDSSSCEGQSVKGKKLIENKCHHGLKVVKLVEQKEPNYL